jgi:hypothetical protein
MTLMDANEYDASRDRKRRLLILSIVIAVIVLAWAAYHLRNYSQRHAADKFFAAIQKQDYESAYGIWQNDPGWKQHQDKYQTYSYADFFRDWGPGGEWGLVKNYSIDCSFATTSGVIVQATVNQRAQHPYLWISKKDNTLSFSPTEIQCGNWFAWLTE